MNRYWIEFVAERKSNLSGREGWVVASMEKIGPDATIVRSGFPRPIKRGKRKGELTWRGVEMCEPVIVTNREIDEERTRYEAETGNCGHCLGKGKQFLALRAGTGKEFGPCRECGGTGKAGCGGKKSMQDEVGK